MALCGFNPKMLEGLAAFSEGLVEHGLNERREKNHETVEQGIRREISDMTRLLADLGKIDNVAKRILTEGLVKYAQGFYMFLRTTGTENYKSEVRKLMEYFKAMDGKYYGELEGRSDDMEKLIEFLDSYNFS